jgi:hypothetical protein
MYMAELSLEPDEKLIISSHAKFSEYKVFGNFNTGDAYLTSKRFVFMGRSEIKTWFHLISVAAGRSRKHFEVKTSSFREVKKKRLENTIVVKYDKGIKTGKFLLKPQKTRYLGTIAGLGLGILGSEMGEKIGDSLSGKIGDMVGGAIGGQVGSKIGEISGETVQEMKGKSLSNKWLDAFDLVMYQKGHWTPKNLTVPNRNYIGNEGPNIPDSTPSRFVASKRFLDRIRHIFSVSTDKPPRMGIVTMRQIFEEELGRDFGNFEIPVRRVTYLEELMDIVENARNPKDREIFSEQLRLYLHQLKKERDLFMRKNDQGN